MTRDITRPAPGFFRRRYVTRGPWVGARIVRLCACTAVPAAVQADATDMERKP